MEPDDQDEERRMIYEGCPHCHEPHHEPRYHMPPNPHDDGHWPEEMNPNRKPEPTLAVTGVRGRFPARPKALKQEDIEVSVTQLEPGALVVRMDSRTDETFWMQITIKLRGGDT